MSTSESLDSRCDDKVKTIIQRSSDSLSRFYDENKVIFWSVYAINIIVFSYLFTQIGFTNHTFPQAWTFEYPSYRTLMEGRWFSDLLLWALGGVGVQSTQMYISVALHIINALLIAKIFRIENKVVIFLAATFISLYPSALDRYAFPGSQITFVVADSFAVLAVLVLMHQKTATAALLRATPLLVLCLATYQPAIAFATFLVLAHCIFLVLQKNGSEEVEGLPLKRLATAASALLLGMLTYYATVKITVIHSSHQRAHISSITEIYSQVKGSFSFFIKSFSVWSDYLPQPIQWLPLAVVVIGSISLMTSSRGKGKLSIAAIMFLLLFVPVALRATYIINSETFEHTGRLVYQYGIALLFFLVCMFRIPLLKNLSKFTMLLFIYYFFVVSCQETNKAYLKMTFDTNKINRIVTRVENVVPDLYENKWPLVVIGNFGRMDQDRYKLYPNQGNASHMKNDTFANYRQTEILNFYLGEDVIIKPTIKERDRAISSVGDRRPWPAPESVYVDDGTIVVLLEAYLPEKPITSSSPITITADRLY